VRSGSSAPIVSITCEPSVVPDPDVQLRVDRAAFADLPDGPAIDGAPTRVAVHLVGTTEVRNYLDAATGQPVRSTQGAPGGDVELQTTYLAWEERPAGGASADLVTAVPAGAKLSPAAGRRGCLERN
jgi:hypothetical protein